MDRRSFLLGLGAAGLAACAQPERDLLAGRDLDAIDLRPAPPPSTTAPVGTGTAAPSTTSPFPFFVPEEDWPGISFVARARTDRVEAYFTLVDSEPAWTFDNPIPSGGDLVFLVDELAEADRHRVLLPVRPNGTFGWVDIDDVELERHNYAILVELSEFRFTLFDHEETAFTTVVGVARDNAPTPDGVYYTTELLRPPVPDTAYGAYAYGLSGYSEVFEEFAGGPGQLGIHGTNDPASIGSQVSSGCIRMLDEDITFLVETVGLPVGVPVEVRA